jgi:tetratricopeptide (TPR) repeat protein
MKVFLAHSSIDKNFVRNLKNDLQNYGYETWFDEDDILAGESIIESIQNGIDNSDFVSVVLTFNSVNSNWVKRELNAALTKEINVNKVLVVPILRDDCEIPGFLRDKKYADFRSSYIEGFDSLLKAFKFDRSKVYPNQDITQRRIGLIRMAWDLMKKGITDLAEVKFQQALDLSPEDATIWHDLGICILHQELPANALIAFKKADELYPNNKTFLYDLGTCALIYYSHGQDDPWGMYPDPELDKKVILKLAESCLEKCKRLDDKDPVVCYQLALVYLGKNEKKKAINELEAAIKLKPDYQKALDALQSLNK